MNYNALRFFSVLAQVEHYTVAAARLGISQPALSSAIHNLENELGGVKLFKKVGRNIRLTEEGRFYQQRVDAALKELHEASLVLRNSNSSAPVIIRMGFVSGALDGLLAQKIVEYGRENPRVRFHLTESSAENLMDMVRQEKLDMAIVDSTGQDRSLHFRMLHQRNLYAALPCDHPLANRELLHPQEILHENQVVVNYNVEHSFVEWASGKPEDEHVLCTVDTAETALEQRELTAALDRFLDTLEPRARAVFLLRYWYGESVSAMAVFFDMRANSVSQLLARTRKRLAQFLEKEGYL